MPARHGAVSLSLQVMLDNNKKTGKIYAVKVLSKKTIKQRDEVKHIMAGAVFASRRPFLVSAAPKISSCAAVPWERLARFGATMT